MSFVEIYKDLSNEALVQLAHRAKDLVPDAKSALNAELLARGLPEPAAVVLMPAVTPSVPTVGAGECGGNPSVESTALSDYPLLGRRYAASVLDVFAVITIVLILVMANQADDPISNRFRMIVILSVPLLYEPFLTAFGCTVGQRLTGIRVRSYEQPSRHISLFLAYLRFFSKVIFGLPSFLWVLFNKNRRAIHDFIGCSIVLGSKSPLLTAEKPAPWLQVEGNIKTECQAS